MKKIIEKEEFSKKLSKYPEEIIKLFSHLMNANIYFFINKDKLVVFNAYGTPSKLYSIKSKVFTKIIKNKKLTFSNFKELKSKLEEFEVNSFTFLSRKNFIQKLEPKTKITELKINISNYCTLNCDYCFQKEKNTKRLTFEQCKEHIDSFMETYKCQSFLLTLAMTSEPFLDFELIKQIYKYVQEKCLDKLKASITKQDIYSFLGISSDEEYLKILNQRDYYKSSFKNMDKRFISDSLEKDLINIDFISDKNEIQRINKEVIYTSLSASKDLYYLCLCTNGTIKPSKEDLEFIKKLYSYGPLNLSFDGNFKGNSHRKYPNGKPSYNDVLENIHFFQNNGIKLKINCTITEDNNDFLKLIKFFHKNNITDFKFNLKKGVYSKSLLKNIRKFYKAYYTHKIDSLYGFEKFGSNIHKDFIYLINCEDCHRKCIGFDNKEYYCDYFIGNNLNLPKSGINVLRRNKCTNCPFALICGGTCQAITRSTSIDEKSCEVRQEIFKQIIYFTS